MPKINQDFANIVARALNTHGHGFHHVVKKYFQEKAKDPKNRWPKINEEFPVQLQGKDTRIDLLFTRGIYARSQGVGAAVVCECKRANPAVSNWVFFSSKPDEYYPVIETIFKGVEHGVATVPMSFDVKTKIFSLGLAIRADLKGDGELKGSTHAAIEDAVTQVFRCTNGFIETLAREDLRLWNGNTDINILPIVITTAKLFACMTDLNSAHISTGDIHLEEGNLENVNWVFLNYPLSLSLRHGVNRVQRSIDLTDYKNDEYVRTVAIVNADGLDQFLEELPWFENFQVDDKIKATY